MRLKNPKAKGARAERRVRDALLRGGCRYVGKAGGSLGLFDLIALREDLAFLVQVKCNNKPGKIEMKALTDFKAPKYARKWLVVVPDREQPIWTQIL